MVGESFLQKDRWMDLSNYAPVSCTTIPDPSIANRTWFVRGVRWDPVVEDPESIRHRRRRRSERTWIWGILDDFGEKYAWEEWNAQALCVGKRSNRRMECSNNVDGIAFNY